MKKLRKYMSEPFAKSSARSMKYMCYLAMLVSIIGIVLSFMGRMAFTLHTRMEIYNRVVYADKNPTSPSTGLSVSLKNEIAVFANDEGEVDLKTHIGLSVMFAISYIPLIIALWFLSRVFDNISNGQIFTEQNASFLFYYGIIQIAAAVLVPFLKLFIVLLVNHFSSSHIAVQAGTTLFNDAIPNIASLVAAYIIHHGVHLQDEADHTL